MNSLPKEIQLKEISQYLDYKSIINLSRINREFCLINENDILWKFLLYRDFGVEYEVMNIKNLHRIYKSDDILLKHLLYKDFENKIINIKNLYMLYICALEKLTKVHPIITQRALLKVIENIPKSDWGNLCLALRDCDLNAEVYILSVNNLMEAVNYDDYDLDGYRFSMHYEIGFAYGISNFIWSDFDIMLDYIENDPSKYKDVVSKQNFIFVDKCLILCKYDYELAEQFIYEASSYNVICHCDLSFGGIIDEILNLRIKV